MLPQVHEVLGLLEGGFSNLRILVVGDIMLDRYIHGEPSPAVVNERAVFNFECLRAIYDCAASGRSQTVERITA